MPTRCRGPPPDPSSASQWQRSSGDPTPSATFNARYLPGRTLARRPGVGRWAADGQRTFSVRSACVQRALSVRFEVEAKFRTRSQEPPQRALSVRLVSRAAPMKTLAQPRWNLWATSPRRFAAWTSRRQPISAGFQRVVSGCTAGAPDRYFCLRRGGLIRYEDFRADTLEPPRTHHLGVARPTTRSQPAVKRRTACAQRAVSVRSADTLRSRQNVGLAF